MLADLYTSGTLRKIEGPLLFLRRNLDVGLNDAVEVIGKDGRGRLGRVASLDEETIVIEVLESTAGLSLEGPRVRFFGEPLLFAVGPGLLGRVYDGVGRILDGGPPLPGTQRWRIDGMPLNPTARAAPADFIETGVSAIDLMNSLVRGQKLPIFSGGGLPHDRMAVQIAQHARLPDDEGGRFAIVFAGIGIPYDVAEYFRRSMEESGVLAHTALFLNLASDPSTQRLLTPRFALTAAEYLAFREERHVLVIMTDMTNYCEALREVAASHGEIPGRKGYPAYLYSDLAQLFERAGRLRARGGTLTQMPILTMPADDISHPIPDLTGYITEGQVVLSRDLAQRQVYPPVAVLPSLSRLMKDGIGEGSTFADHPDLANQLFAAYARATRVRVLASVVGTEGLAESDLAYLAFADRFEREFLTQPESRTLAESAEIGWKVLRDLPLRELSRLDDRQIAAHIKQEQVDER